MAETTMMKRSGAAVEKRFIGLTPGTCCSTEMKRKKRLPACENWCPRNLGRKVHALYLVVYTELLQ